MLKNIWELQDWKNEPNVKVLVEIKLLIILTLKDETKKKLSEQKKKKSYY